ncbi:MinD superfamily P-loop ATPase [Methanomicrobium sp. W14]|uniref:nucleotide-binding protein n=1 Tax=Methanomicrobium sp. W14 TaxID=2817839 RepID=UPI001AE3B7A6|nr:MinD superfamily P-loop ATPase [Methanomicrobium sp. W14]
MRITVASGKGGTGKTTFSANFAWSVSKNNRVMLTDCDVEEPNLHIFFGGEKTSEEVFAKKPRVDAGLCTFCGKCAGFCRFGAINVLKNRVLISDPVCHSCGGCTIICPENAISETEVSTGEISVVKVSPNLTLAEGRLYPGQPSGTGIIKALKGKCEKKETVISDAPPGSACLFLEAVSDSDYCILVTEPTPFGLHDLKAAYEAAKATGVPTGVVINKSLGDDCDVEEFCRLNSLEVIMKIPNDIKIAEIQNRGELFSEIYPEWTDKFTSLYGRLCNVIRGGDV